MSETIGQPGATAAVPPRSIGEILGIVLVIPGIYIGVRLAVSTQALVVEGRQGTEAVRRSWDLVGRLSRRGRPT